MPKRSWWSCLVAGRGWGTGSLFMYVLRCTVPTSEQVDQAHPLSLLGLTQVPGPYPTGRGNASVTGVHGSSFSWQLQIISWLRRHTHGSWLWASRHWYRPLSCAVQVLRKVLSWCRFSDWTLTRSHRRQTIQMWILWKSLQVASPHERPLQSAHRGTPVPVFPLRKDVFTIHNPEGTWEDTLSQICAQVPVLTEPRSSTRTLWPFCSRATLPPSSSSLSIALTLSSSLPHSLPN